VFIDTPGIHRPRSKLGQFMVRQAGDSISDVDVVVLVTEWSGAPTETEKQIALSLAEGKIRLFSQSIRWTHSIKRSLCLKKSAGVRTLRICGGYADLRALRATVWTGFFWKSGRFVPRGRIYSPTMRSTDQPDRAIIAEITGKSSYAIFATKFRMAWR
jgi:GTP-binding protein Era